MKKGKMKTDRIWQAGLAFALLLLLCGCTKKEELLLLSEEAAGAVQDLSAFPQDAGGEMPTSGETERVTEGSQWGSDGENREYGMSAAAEKEAALQAQSGVIYVHVCGAVIKPGVYELETGSRVYEAVQQAGGFAENAEQNYVNQAQVLDDGVKLVIPTQEEAAAVQERETVSPAGAAQDGALEKNGIVQAGREKELGIVGGLSADGKSAGEGAENGRFRGRPDQHQHRVGSRALRNSGRRRHKGGGDRGLPGIPRRFREAGRHYESKRHQRRHV